MLELQGSDRQVSVFRLEADDWPTARDLRLRALRESPLAFLGDLSLEDKFVDKQWRRELEANAWFLAKLDKRPVGLAKLNLIQEQDDGMHLEALWVAPAARGRGVGETLVSAVENAAATTGARQLSLWILNGNHMAPGFYQHLGFTGPHRTQVVRAASRVTYEKEYRKQLDPA